MAPKRKAVPKTKVVAEPDTLPDLSGVTVRRNLKNGKNRTRNVVPNLLQLVSILPSPTPANQHNFPSYVATIFPNFFIDS